MNLEELKTEKGKIEDIMKIEALTNYAMKKLEEYKRKLDGLIEAVS